jgi:hypothetical protein
MPPIQMRIELYDDLSASELLPSYMNKRRAVDTSATLTLEVVHRLLRCSQQFILDYAFFPAWPILPLSPLDRSGVRS